METRSMAKKLVGESIEPSKGSRQSSSSSAATILAERCAAEARHARLVANEAARTAELAVAAENTRRVAEQAAADARTAEVAVATEATRSAAERAAADAELRAELARIDAEAISDRSSRLSSLRSSRRSNRCSSPSRKSMVSLWVSQTSPCREPLVDPSFFSGSDVAPAAQQLTCASVPATVDPTGAPVVGRLEPWPKGCIAQMPVCGTTSAASTLQPLPCVSVPTPVGQPGASTGNCRLQLRPEGRDDASAPAASLRAPYCVQAASAPQRFKGGRQVPVTSTQQQPEPPYTTIGTFGTQDTNYFNINKNEIESNILTLARAVTEVARSAANENPKKPPVSLSLPLPFFEGRPTDWLIFKKIYHETSPSLSPSENLVRISAALRGAARDAVSVLIAVARDPAEVMHALETTFARPEHIILAEIAQVKSLPKLSGSESMHELCTFACKVRNCTAVIKLLERPEYLASPELSNEIVSKMTPLLRARWADYASSRESDGHRLVLLSDFLAKEADQRAKYEVFDPTKRFVKGGPTKDLCFNTTVAPPSAKHPTTLVCLFCEAVGHDVKQCKRFSALSPPDRWLWVTEIKVCHKCLTKGGHQYRFCKLFSCNIKGCERSKAHHTLLHKEAVKFGGSQPACQDPGSLRGRIARSPGDKPAVSKIQLALVSEDETVSGDLPAVITSHNLSSNESKGRPLLKVIPVTVSGPKGDVDTFALLDDGSTATLIDSTIADVIGASGRSSIMRVEAINGMAKDCEVNMTNFNIRGRHCDKWYTLENVRSIRNLGLGPQTIKASDIGSYSHLNEIAEGLCYEHAEPTILIGIDHWFLTIPQQTLRGTPTQPVATQTALGWVVFGALKGKANESYNFRVNRISVSPSDEFLIDSIDQQLKQYFSIDSIGITCKEYLSEDNKLAISILDNTTRRLPDGRFETGLPWRRNVNDVPNSYELARSRFLSLERKMQRDPAYAKSYRDNINSTIAKGYAELCQSGPVAGIVWYLPHFGVIHPQKGKLRVVHDAAASCRGTSLNSLLLPGPDLLQPLLAILMRFREGCIAINGDIREMFPQTKIRQEDRDAQRFLWRDDPSKPLGTFRMSSMMFGAVSSPFAALYLKNRNAEEHRGLFPAAAEAIIKDHYMDDYLGSVNTIEEAQRLVADVTHVHAQACLDMRAWVSNVPQALSSIPADSCAQDASIVGVRVLGVNWNTKLDSLSFSRTNFGNPPTKLTKRSVLSHLMKVYDPLGLLVPLVIRGRILFQKSWKLSIDWDQELPSAVGKEWVGWFKDCEILLVGSIPRHYLNHKDITHRPQLHIFADASELAYACVAYWRYQCDDGSVYLSLIGGKARVASLKPVTIPRLELQAALCAARFSTYILEAHNIKPKQTFFWTDSQTVLKWLRCDARSFKPFVAHRVGEISEITRVADWKYVPTDLNVADDATRVEKTFDFTSRWFTGPKFLTLSEPEWPREPVLISPMVTDEMKRPFRETITAIHAQNLPTPVVPDATRFSSWSRLLRATARVVVAVKLFKCTLLVPNLSKEPTAEDICAAERQLLLQSQLNSMKEDYVKIARGEAPIKEGQLRGLTVCIDERERLMRLSGRIELSRDTPVSNSPVILHGKDRIVQLLIAYYHERAAHGNNEMVVNELRGRYHVIGLRPAVKRIAGSCLRCRIRKAQPIEPPMGILPPERLAHHTRPFTFVGLDYFGPMLVTVGRHKEKRYVALFTCLTVRAIHLEVVNSLTSDSAIMALRRFVARRGVPTKIMSDNGTSFVGANGILSQQPLLDYATNMRIEWSFIPPAAPFMGGCWERLVRSVKSALSTTLHTRAPSEEILFTFLLEAESIINSRPLTHVGVTAGEDQAITPFHFILGSSSPHSVVGHLDDTDLIRRVTWKKGLRLADHFWTRWVREYLPSLVPRPNSASSGSLQIGDQVLIVDGNLPRGVWPRGRVAKLFPGRDGVVRVINVDTIAGTLRRPVRKVVPLPK